MEFLENFTNNTNIKIYDMRRMSKSCKALGLLCLMLMFPLWALAQGTITVKGVVSDDDGPIIGATVKEKGASGGVISDLDGNYSLTVKKGATVTFSYIGYVTKEVKITNQTRLDVHLQQDTKLLNEVVVVGYGQMKRSDLTGSVVSVGEKSIEQSVPTSIDQVLQGRAAGVQIQANTGTPGGSSTIRIRGTNSLNATSQPIFVIDGVIIDSTSDDDNGNTNPLAAINPSDIVSMDILKDASATAIYGSRASNGVIMITTKRGQSGEAQITYDGYIGWQQMPKKLDVMNLQEYAQHNNDLAEAEIKEASNSFVRPDLLNAEGTDWQDELYRNALMTSHNLSLSGGNKDVTYALSGGYLQQDGIAIGSSYKRQTLRGNIDANLKSWLKGGINFSLADSKQNTATTYNIIMTALQSQPSVAVRNPNGGYDGPDDVYMPDNPVALAEIRTNYNKKSNFRVNTYLEATILKGLTFKTELSADYNFNRYYYYEPDYTFGVKVNATRTGTWTKTDTKYWSWRNILTFNRTFAEKHTLNVMIGQEMSHNHWETQIATTTGFLSNTATDISAGNLDDSSAKGQQDNTSLFSYFGRAFYNYDEKYLLTATIRRDGSSKFAKDNRWGWFPSAAFAWRISNENFLKDNPVISNMKLRLGWGATGNQNVENWAYMAMLNTYTTNWGVGVLNANNANPNLKWETTYSTNIGLDISLFHNRIEFIADWYYKKTKDLLLKMDLPGFLGSGAGTIESYGVASNPWANVGSLRNTGFEFTLNTVNIDKGGFQWRTNAVLSLNRNKVLSLDTETGTLPQSLSVGEDNNTVTFTEVGKPIGQFYGYKVIGRFDKPEDFYYKDADGNVKQVAMVDQTIGKNNTWLGDYIYADINNDGVIDENDKTIIGNPEPKFTWGLGNTFSYKGFDLTIQLSGSYGNDVLNYNRRFIEITGGNSNQLKTVMNYARVEKIDPNGPDDFRNYYVSNASSTIMPRICTKSASKNYEVSDRYIEDGSYIRIQNISLAYTLPKSLLRKTFLNNVKFYCNIQNLYTWTKYDGYDPEVGSLWGKTLMNGVDYGRYPSPRIYTFGVNVSF